MAGANITGRGNTQQMSPFLYYNNTVASFDASQEDAFKALPLLDLSQNATNNNKISLITIPNSINQQVIEQGSAIKVQLYRFIQCYVKNGEQLDAKSFWIMAQEIDGNDYTVVEINNLEAAYYKLVVTGTAGNSVNVSYTYEPINVASPNVRFAFKDSVENSNPSAVSFLKITSTQEVPIVNIQDQVNNIPVIHRS